MAQSVGKLKLKIFMHTKTNRGIKFKFSLRLLIGIGLLAASSHVMSQTLAWSKTLDLPTEFKTNQSYYYVNSISHNNLSSAMILSAYPTMGDRTSSKYFLYWFGPKGEIIHKSELPNSDYYNLDGISSNRLAVRVLYDAYITYTRGVKNNKVTSKIIKTLDQRAESMGDRYQVILGSQDLFGFFVMQRNGDSIVLKRYNL